ncbi:MAG: DUF3108 domain-containing protein [Gemmatimonadales bacterium]
MIPLVVTAVLLQAIPTAAPPAPVPWGVGESFEYDGKYLVFKPGGATMSVVGIDTVRGVPSWHFKLTMHVSIPFYKNDSDLESWTGVSDFVSRRFVHVITENGKRISNDDFNIFGDSGFFRNHSESLTRPTPPQPLDDLAFVYYIRAMDLRAGGKYLVPRYFRNDRNPVEVDVIGHDSLEMPDGSRCFCWVLHPVVDEPNGLFSRKNDARLWLTDDGLRIPVQIRSNIGGPSALTLKLRKITRPH